MKKRMLALLLAGCLSLSLLAACGGGGEETPAPTGSAGGEEAVESISIAITTAEASMDPIKTADGAYVTLIGNVIGGLYCVDQNGVLQLDLAESMTKSEDGLTYTFTLRDTTWSNGTPLTANDFVFAWRRMADPTSGTQYAYLMEEAHIKNCHGVISGELTPDQLGVTAIDEKTLQVELEIPTPYFESMTAFSPFAPLNEEYVTAQGDQFALTKDNLIYCGAYTLTDWDVAGNTITMTKNENYWDAASVDVEVVNFQVVPDSQQAVMSYENGDLDRITLTGDLVGQYLTHEDFSSALGNFNWFLYFNDEAVPNVKLRQAIAYCIDREDLVNNVMKDGSVAQYNILMTGLYVGADGTDFNEDCEDQFVVDKEAAKKLWAEAQAETDMRSITLVYEEDSAFVSNVAAYIQSEVETTLEGFTVELQRVPKKNRIESMTSGDYDVALHRWGPDYNDPSCIMSLYATDNYYNYCNWSNAEYDALMDQCTNELALDTEARWNAYVQAEHILVESAVCVPIFQVADAVMTRQGINGIASHVTGIDCYYKYVTVD